MDGRVKPAHHEACAPDALQRVRARNRGLGFLSIPPYINSVVSCSEFTTMPQRPRDLADRMSQRRKPDDGFLRETFTLPRLAARARARAFLDSYPAAGYMSKVENWRELPDGQIEFTMRRLKSAD
jgi:hypothetical protein